MQTWWQKMESRALCCACYLLYVQTASSCVDGRCRRGRTRGRRPQSLSERSSSSQQCVCSLGQEAFLQEKCNRECHRNVSEVCWSWLSAGWNPKLTLGCVVHAKVRCSVDDDALDRNAEALVQTLDAVRLADLHQTVTQAFELTLRWGFSHVGSQTRPGEVEGVDETERSGPGGTTRCQVACKVSPELGAFVYAIKENLLVLVLESKVEGLCGEVPDDIGQVPSPEREESLLFGNTDNAVDDSFVLLVDCNLLACMLYLWLKHRWSSTWAKQSSCF